jgi:hypothetical protein
VIKYLSFRQSVVIGAGGGGKEVVDNAINLVYRNKLIES